MEQTTAPFTPSAADIVFILDTLPDWQSLAAAAPAGAEVVRLDGNADALAQMASYVEGRKDIGAIHIVSHGAPGSLQLGTATVNAANLDAHLAQWQALGQALSAGGDILLYGCDVAAGAQGQAFVQALADLTGADVAASTDLTGNAAKGGNWVLESQTGAVQASTDWAQYTQFSAVLADQTINLAGAISSGSLASGDFTISGVRFQVSSASGFTITQESGGLKFVETSANGDFQITITDTGANNDFSGKSIVVTNSSTGGDPGFGPQGSINFVAATSSIIGGTNTLYMSSNGSSGGTYSIQNQITVTDVEINGFAMQTVFLLKDFVVDLDATDSPVDTTPPTVSSLSSSTANGSYKADDVIAVQVNFSENVIVTGTPQLTLETGATDRTVSYASGSGTSTLVFNYTVQAGDSNGDLDYLSTTALALNGGTLKDAAGNNATLTLPSPGAANSLGANKNIIVDTAAPSVSGVTSSTANGTYKVGDVIAVQVNFSEVVTVTGTPQLTLETGATDQVLNYTSGNGTSTLVFNYTVQAGDTSIDLDTLSTTALALNGGSIKDAAGNNATLTLPTPGAANSLGANKAIVIDGVAPTVSSVNSGTANGTYKVGDVIAVQVNFSEVVTVTGTPRLTLETGTTDQVLNYTSGSGSSALTFNYTVQAGDTSLDLDYLSTSALALNGGSIKDAAGNNATLTLPTPGAANSLGANKAIVIDGVAPTVSSVNSGTANGTYKVGDVIAVQVNFSEVVTVTGTPRLTLETGTTDQVLNYTSGSGSSALTFNYTVQAGDTSLDLDYLSTSALALNGGSIKDAAGNNATLTLPTPGAANSLGANKAIVVDGSAPAVATVNRVGPAATNATSVDYTVTFSEGVSGVDAADFTATGTSGTVAGAVGNVVANSATSYTVTVNGITGEGALRLDLNASGTGIADTAGNAIAAGFTAGQTIAIDTTPPTATVTVAPAAVGAGQTATVSVIFSEAVTGFDNADLAIAHGSLSPMASGDGGITWTGTFTPDANTESATNLIVLTNSGVQDLAGNARTGTVASGNYVVDTKAPVFASATVNDKTLVLTYTEGLALDAANPPATGAFSVMVGAAPNAVAAVAVNAAAKTVTLTLTTAVANGDVVTVAYTDPSGANDPAAIQDAAGNDAATLAATAVTNNTPAPESPPPPSTTVDGVPVTTEPGPGGSTVITIPVIVPTRPDVPGTPSPLADIPLVKGADGHPIVEVSVPVGVGLQAEGLSGTTTGSAALAELGFRIERIAGDNPELINAGQVFYASMPPNDPLSVQILKPTAGTGFDATVPLVITGSNAPADGKQAIILDARSLPSGAVIQVDNIDFIAVVGNVRLIGGAGQNVASGDGGAQWIVLGPDDDVIHGGAGNDVVGSEAGDDQVYGDAGDDIVFGGAGNDLLSGGTGSDKLNGGTGFDVAIQEGARSDYTVTLEGAGIKLTHTASGVSDWLVDVEQVRFATGPSLTVAHSAAEEAGAYLFQKWLGRDLNQGEGAIIQTLTGKTALEVATLFAQFFPEQSGGRTPAQLLEGMGAAGAVRVDAIRDVTVTGDAGNNIISPTLGLARYVDGGAGTDTVVIPATLSQTYVQSQNNGSFTLQRLTDGAMLDVTRLERVSFSDTNLALDLNGNAGQAAKLLGALGGPALLGNKGVVGEVIRLLDAGAGSQTIAGLGLQLLGVNTPTQIAQMLWANVVGRAGTDSELKLLTDIMAGGVSASDLVVMAANLDANAVRIDLVGLTAKGIEFA